jgi:hypothetical protein
MMQADSLVSSPRLSAKQRRIIYAVLAVLAKCVFAFAAFASAQEPNVHSWQAVMSLPAGTRVDVKVRSQQIHCVFTSADDKALTCTHGKNGAPVVLDRNDVRSVKVGHRLRSTLIGAGVGGGSLGIAGFASTTGGGDSLFGPNFLRGEITGLSALAGGLIGGGIGAITDFSKSTVYSAR